MGACAAAGQLLEEATTMPRGATSKWAQEVVEFLGQCCRDMGFALRLRQGAQGRAPWRASFTAPLHTLLDRLCALREALRRRHPACLTRATLALFRLVHLCNAHRPDDEVTMTPDVATAAVQTVLSRGRPGTVLLFEALHVMGWACTGACTAVPAADLLAGLTMVDVVRSSFKAAGVLDPARTTIAELRTHLPQVLVEPLVDVVTAAAARCRALLHDPDSLAVCVLVAGVATADCLPESSPAYAHTIHQGFTVLRDVLQVLVADPAACVARLGALQGPLMEVAAGLLRLSRHIQWLLVDVDDDDAVDGKDDTQIMCRLRRLLPLCGRVAELSALTSSRPSDLCVHWAVEAEVARRRRVWTKRRARWVFAAALAAGGHVP